MKQILQNLKTGITEIAEVPVPIIKKGCLLIKTTNSLLSAGTERMLVEFGKASLIDKAKQQPDKVKQIIDKIKTDGLISTVNTVFNRLDEPLPMGYCNVGEVIDVGANVSGFQIGDRVASNGAHAEYVCIPQNLCAKIPQNVTNEQATFTVLGSIGLQGVRLFKPELGEKVIVYGAGLIGLIVIQLLLASGCEVLAIDLNKDRLEIAKKFGAQIYCPVGKTDQVSQAVAFSDGIGVDGVIITASAKTDEIIHYAAQMCRKRGRIVLVGVVGLNIQRSDFYEKELTFQVSCSYGPGRYDNQYEQNGLDYPVGFVRWTEGRNFNAILSSISSGKIDINSLITHRFDFSQSVEAYKTMTENKNALGIILKYSQKKESFSYTVKIKKESDSVINSSNKCIMALIGAGNYAKMTLAPSIAKTSAKLEYVAARTNGANAVHIAKKYGFRYATTDINEVLNSKTNLICIATSHNSHASLIKASLNMKKHTFVEKPLCLNEEELLSIKKIYEDFKTEKPLLMVGFNRRFSSHIQKIKELLSIKSGPISLCFNANAGFIPENHWTQDPNIGGGRIIGEACHYIDLLQYLTESRIKTVNCQFLSPKSNNLFDTATISIGFEDGSIGVVNYFSNGNKSYPKEKLEVFFDGKIIVLDNFNKTTGYGFSHFSHYTTWNQDKGHDIQFSKLVNLIEKGGKPLIPFHEIINSTLASFAAQKSGKEHRTIIIDDEYPQFV